MAPRWTWTHSPSNGTKPSGTACKYGQGLCLLFSSNTVKTIQCGSMISTRKSIQTLCEETEQHHGLTLFWFPLKKQKQRQNNCRQDQPGLTLNTWEKFTSIGPYRWQVKKHFFFKKEWIIFCLYNALKLVNEVHGCVLRVQVVFSDMNTGISQYKTALAHRSEHWRPLIPVVKSSTRKQKK